jgi:hypothetical protein
MAVVRDQDPFQPVLGDDIGPTPAERTRNGALLVVVLIALGLLAALALGLGIVVLWAAFTAALG